MDEKEFGKKESPFQVPENYFEDFEARMLKNLEPEAEIKLHRQDSITTIKSVIKPWLAMAASFLVIAMVYYFAPHLFGDVEETAFSKEWEEEYINSLALIFDENEINELVIKEDTFWVFPPDSLFVGEFTEEELAAVTYFE
ncbi:hypothetical protein ACT29H_10530 [Thermophagus sp. OGC60D27]|uniref:hypothetical protein n=1 Tax=Thermophagus sp. OGC60D27 TaxID=3458415 RepID=UPI004037C8E9